MDCLFCSIAGSGDKLIWQNEWATAFDDINPKASTHVLIVPKAHIANLDSLENELLAGHLLMAVKEVAAQLGLVGNYRLAMNNGRAAGQIVEHLHFHLLSSAGRA